MRPAVAHTFDNAAAMSRGELARWWAEQPPGAGREHLCQLLEGPGLSRKLEELAVTAALAAAVRHGLGEMLHRAAFSGSTVEQLAAATGPPATALPDAWMTWAGQQRAASLVPVAEFQHVADRLAGKEHTPYAYPQWAVDGQPG
ncbi:hypothetical protein [Catellatospora tritici]|uniref:hypothetical protein n=1 Tax=Catellatospora tritici TaxID=2851566 RepID=UPI001C2D4D39|nr:hypothetical protein [Catellatospora tritici]MBV1855731.1 hypothetical protein [Catellatospora tritici]